MATLLFRVNSGTPFSVDEIPANQINELPEGIDTMCTFAMKNAQGELDFFLLTYNGSSKIVEIYQPQKDNKYIVQVTTGELASAPTIIHAFSIAQQPWLLTYNPTSKYAVFYSVESDFTILERYQAKIGEGYSTVHPFAYRFGIFFVAYNIKSGAVDRYQLMVPSHGYLHAQSTWTDQWAHGWTRFAFFQMGGENYFIKTNIDYHKVNIDHFMDDPTEGSHPVCNIDVPDQMKGLQNVAAFTNGIGDPYFATYRANGEMTFNKFHGNGLGWTILHKLTSSANAQLLQPIDQSTDNLVLLYSA